MKKIDNQNNNKNNNNEVLDTSHPYMETMDNPLICLTRGMVFCNFLNKVFVELEDDIEILHILENEFHSLEKEKKTENSGLMNALRCFYFDWGGERKKELYPFKNYLQSSATYGVGDSPKPFSGDITLMLIEIGSQLAFGKGKNISEWSFLRDGDLKNHKFFEGEDTDSLKPVDWKDADAGEKNWSLFPRFILRMERFLDLYKGGIDDNELFRDVYDKRTVWSWNESWMSDQEYSEHQKYGLIRSHGQEPSKEGMEYWGEQFLKYYDADAGICTDCYLMKHYPELLPDEDSLQHLFDTYHQMGFEKDYITESDDDSIIEVWNTGDVGEVMMERLNKETNLYVSGQTIGY